MQKLVLGTAQFGMKYGLDNNNIFRSKRIVNRDLKFIAYKLDFSVKELKTLSL